MTYIIMMFFFLKFQVIEFVQFKERLQHSNQYLVARVEGPILQLKQNADNIEEEEVLYDCRFCSECLYFDRTDNCLYYFISVLEIL